MSLPVLIGIAVGLAMDALAVAIGVSISLRGATPRQIFRLSFHFGLFQGVMPILGWLSGYYAAQFVSHISHYIAFGLLAFIGARAVTNALRGNDGPAPIVRDPTRGASLIMLSLATSMDAFVVGVSFAIMSVRVWYPAVVIGVVTCGLSVAGMLFGSRIGRRFGVVMEIVGGGILILIGVNALVSGLWR
ncbi:MAG TPA: manganese efflux pump [Candidatus Hydrogenedentes bacterium]|nr:manganese efflux pump [Candidatus Hydrogenedentota bacterium]